MTPTEPTGPGWRSVARVRAVFQAVRGRKADRRRAGTGRLIHYYARYLQHPSGVTDSIDHWAELGMSVLPVEIWAARPLRGSRNEFARTELVRLTAHFGRSRQFWVSLAPLVRLRSQDVVVLHEGWVLSNVVVAASALVRRAKYVVVPHGVYEKQVVSGQRDIGGLRHRAETWVLRHAAAVHVFYEGEKHLVRNVAPTVSNFIVLPNGAPAVNVENSWVGDGDYFLWIGRFDPHHKGLDNLVKFWSAIPAPVPRLILAGPDFMGGRRRVQDLIEAEGMSHQIELRGRVTGIEKSTLISAARAYLHPSRWESCSITLLEMLAAGVPCLVSESIHAAAELEPLGVLRSADFSQPSDQARIRLGDVDANSDLGRRAARWATTEGSWSSLRDGYAAALRSIRAQNLTAS